MPCHWDSSFQAVNKKMKKKKYTDHLIKWTFSNLIKKEREWGCNQEYISLLSPTEAKKKSTPVYKKSSGVGGGGGGQLSIIA